MEEIMFGKYAMPVVLTILLALFYKFVPIDISDKYKALFAVTIGVGLGLLAILYAGLDWSWKVAIDYALAGLMAGASAIGIYEVQRTVTKPRG